MLLLRERDLYAGFRAHLPSRHGLSLQVTNSLTEIRVNRREHFFCPERRPYLSKQFWRMAAKVNKQDLKINLQTLRDSLLSHIPLFWWLCNFISSPFSHYRRYFLVLLLIIIAIFFFLVFISTHNCRYLCSYHSRCDASSDILIILLIHFTRNPL